MRVQRGVGEPQQKGCCGQETSELVNGKVTSLVGGGTGLKSG